MQRLSSFLHPLPPHRAKQWRAKQWLRRAGVVVCTLGLAGLLGLAEVGVALGQEPADAPPAVPELPETVVSAQPSLAPNLNPFDTDPAATEGFTLNRRFSGRAQDVTAGERTSSASQGLIGPGEIQFRPIGRPSEILETIPGLISTQHGAGSGKAPQYFLRGFALDHGTDLTLKLDGMTLNMPTHPHSQGYLDSNFLIPELIQSIEYKLGPYYADIGDFSFAGAALIKYANVLPDGISRITPGSYGYERLLVADSPKFAGGHLLYAFETQFYHGPFTLNEDLNRYNGVLKYSLGDEDLGFALSAMAYKSTWNMIDQIPLRAVADGSISRLGVIDPTDNGVTNRDSLNAEYWDNGTDTRTTANAWLTYYNFNLYSDFTFFQDDPVNGDQIEQTDNRTVYGANVEHAVDVGNLTHTVGFQSRFDDIQVGLNHSKAAEKISTIRSDHVDQANLAIYCQNIARVTDEFRIVTGLRGDLFYFDVVSQTNAANSGIVSAGIFSPKLNFIYTPYEKTAFYLNLGMGYHSNDGRGTTLTVDPVTGLPVTPVTPLVRTKGIELGTRFTPTEGWNSSVALYYQNSDSELVFSGDEGTTEALGKAYRMGFQINNFYQVNEWLTLDVDANDTRTRFYGVPEDENRVPLSPTDVVACGPSLYFKNGMYANVRLRHWGPRPLIEDNSVRSQPTNVCNMQVGYRGQKFWIACDVLNVFNSKDHAIDYYYSSQLQGEAAPVNDIHFTPVVPISVRLSMTYIY